MMSTQNESIKGSRLNCSGCRMQAKGDNVNFKL